MSIHDNQVFSFKLKIPVVDKKYANDTLSRINLFVIPFQYKDVYMLLNREDQIIIYNEDRDYFFSYDSCNNKNKFTVCFPQQYFIDRCLTALVRQNETWVENCDINMWSHKSLFKKLERNTFMVVSKDNETLECNCEDESDLEDTIHSKENVDITEPSVITLSHWCECTMGNHIIPRSFNTLSELRMEYEPFVMLDNITWDEISVRHTLSLEVYDTLENLKQEFSNLEKVATVHNLIRYRYITNAVDYSLYTVKGVFILIALILSVIALCKLRYATRNHVRRVSAKRQGNVLHVRTLQPLFGDLE